MEVKNLSWLKSNVEPVVLFVTHFSLRSGVLNGLL